MLQLRLREVAENRGLNLSQLQRRTGLDIGMIRRYWYNEGRRGPLTEVNLPALNKLAQALDVPAGELLVEREQPTPEPEETLLSTASPVPAQRRSLRELRGLGKEHWQAIDSTAYLQQERDSWGG